MNDFHWQVIGSYLSLSRVARITVGFSTTDVFWDAENAGQKNARPIGIFHPSN